MADSIVSPTAESSRDGSQHHAQRAGPRGNMMPLS
jgi:hypothetical protein